jgi:hypothetical protein
MTWEGQRRKRVKWEDGNFEHLRSGQRLCPVHQPAAVRDDDHAGRVGLRDVIDADQAGQLD